MNIMVILYIFGLCLTALIFILQLFLNMSQKATRSLIDNVDNKLTMTRTEYDKYQVANEQAHKDFRIDHSKLEVELTRVQTTVDNCKTCHGGN